MVLYQNKPLVSICIPVYNGEKFIEETLRSIINQTYKNIGIIVSDNASTDNTSKKIKRLMKEDKRIKLNINFENLGFSGNLNKLIELSNSEYIAIYHADDIYKKNIVKEQVKYLEENPKLAGCFTLGKVINGKGEIQNKDYFIYYEKTLPNNLVVNLDFFVKKMCEKGNVFVCPTLMIRKSIYNELGGYNTDIKHIEDQDMWIRILEKYDLGIINKELINYRIHENQGSNYYSSKKRQELSVDLKYIDKYLNKNLEFNIRYRKNLNKRIAIDYLVLARNAIYRNDYNDFKENINKSKQYHIFYDKLKLLIVQGLNCRLNFALLKFFLKYFLKY